MDTEVRDAAVRIADLEFHETASEILKFASIAAVKDMEINTLYRALSQSGVHLSWRLYRASVTLLQEAMKSAEFKHQMLMKAGVQEDRNEA